MWRFDRAVAGRLWRYASRAWVGTLGGVLILRLDQCCSRRARRHPARALRRRGVAGGIPAVAMRLCATWSSRRRRARADPELAARTRLLTLVQVPLCLAGALVTPWVVRVAFGAGFDDATPMARASSGNRARRGGCRPRARPARRRPTARSWRRARPRRSSRCCCSCVRWRHWGRVGERVWLCGHDGRRRPGLLAGHRIPRHLAATGRRRPRALLLARRCAVTPARRPLSRRRPARTRRTRPAALPQVGYRCCVRAEVALGELTNVTPPALRRTAAATRKRPSSLRSRRSAPSRSAQVAAVARSERCPARRGAASRTVEWVMSAPPGAVSVPVGKEDRVSDLHEPSTRVGPGDGLGSLASRSTRRLAPARPRRPPPGSRRARR